MPKEFKQVVACAGCGVLSLATKKIQQDTKRDSFDGDCGACGTSLEEATAVYSWGRSA